MTSKSRDSRRTAARDRDHAAGRNRWLLPVVGGGLLVAAAVIAIVLSGTDSGGGSSALPSAAASALPSGSGGPSASGVAGTEPVVTGVPLTAFTDSSSDTSVGQVIPAVTSPTGSITLDGRPKVLIFLAHWCSYCQKEVPIVQAWLDQGGLPADVDLVSVSTSIDPTLPNYPPEAWLAKERWTPPVIVDSEKVVANAFGLSAFPYFVFVNGDGTLKGRLTGALPIDDIETIIGSLSR